MRETIYEMKHKETYEDIDVASLPKPRFSKLPATGAEFLKMIEEKSEYVVIEERLKEMDSFIEAAKYVADLFKFDIVITQEDDAIKVKMELSDFSASHYVKKVFLSLLSQADDVSIFIKPEATTLLLIYYTHELYLDGKKVRDIC